MAALVMHKKWAAPKDNSKLLTALNKEVPDLCRDFRAINNNLSFEH